MAQANGQQGSATHTTLPKWTLNAEQVLRQGMPALHIGEAYKQTTLKAPDIRKYFAGAVSEWKSFEDEVLQVWNNEQTQRELQACAGIPVAMDPKIELLNEHVMTTERIQCGGECTLSGRFYSNALAPVIHSVQTMAATSYGPGGNAHLPSQLTFGDAWIRDVLNRDNKMQPDVVGKLRIGGEHEVMVDLILHNQPAELLAILGQIVYYMLGHRLKYAFLSTYSQTVCMWLGETKDGNGHSLPRICFSKVIKSEDTLNEADKQINLRAALFYLVRKTFSQVDEDWRISEETLELTKRWVIKEPASYQLLSTPYGVRTKLLVPVPHGEYSVENIIAPKQEGQAPPRRRFAAEQYQRRNKQISTAAANIAPYTPSRVPMIGISRMPPEALLGMAESPSPESSPEVRRLTFETPVQSWAGLEDSEPAVTDAAITMTGLSVADEDATSRSSASTEKDVDQH